MDRFARGVASGLLLAAAGVLAACSGGTSGFLGGAAPAAADAPGTMSSDHPLARPIAVAWTSARAQRCGFYFDPAKLRTSYLAFEAKQSAPEQLAKAEKAYDSTVKSIRERVTEDPDYCSDAKSAAIKKDLTRHLAGDFAPDFPKPKVVESCGFFGCPGTASSGPWDSKSFWEEMEKRQSGQR